MTPRSLFHFSVGLRPTSDVPRESHAVHAPRHQANSHVSLPATLTGITVTWFFCTSAEISSFPYGVSVIPLAKVSCVLNKL